MATALITGASSGIGLELAREFAKHKHGLVLVARSIDKLEQLATELSSAYGTTVKIIQADLSIMQEVQKVYDTCKESNIVIEYLVNNAGFADYVFFHESNWNKADQMIDLNIKSLTMFCRLFIPDMVRNKKGRIMNVASTAAFQPGPTMAVYYATKAYVLHFSEAINNELKKTGVTVTALCPGPTESGFTAAAGLEESRLVKDKKLPSSVSVAKYGYKVMMKGKAVAIHGFINFCLAQGHRIFPRNLTVRLTRWKQEKK